MDRSHGPHRRRAAEAVGLPGLILDPVIQAVPVRRQARRCRLGHAKGKEGCRRGIAGAAAGCQHIAPDQGGMGLIRDNGTGKPLDKARRAQFRAALAAGQGDHASENQPSGP